MEARPVHVFQSEEAVAAAAYEPGQVVQLADGRAAVVQGVRAVESGETYSAITRGDIEFASASATTFSAGADVGWDDDANEAVAAASGDFRIGVVKMAKTSGQTIVRVALNEEPLATS